MLPIRRVSILLVVLLARPVLAQDAPAPLPAAEAGSTLDDGEGRDGDATDAPAPLPPPPVSLSQPEAAPPPAEAAAAPGLVQAKYDRAFEQVVVGDCKDALPLLTEVRLRVGDAPLATRAATLEALCQARLGGLTRVTRKDLLTDTSREGRFPFVAGATLGGLAAGIELLLAIEPDSVTPGVLTVMATTGGAFAASLFATREGAITMGEASLFSSGLIYGTYNAVLLAALVDPGSQGAALMSLGGTILGGTVGFITARGAHLSPGDASLVGSGGLWGSATGLLLLPILQPSSTDGYTLTMMLPMDAGIVLAAVVASQIDISRDRVLLMDLGALLGGLGLGGLGIIVMDATNNFDSARIVSGLALGGIVVGGGLSLYLTRHMDRPDGEAPPAMGALINVDGDRVGLGAPMPMIGPDPTTPGATLTYVNLAAGRF